MANTFTAALTVPDPQKMGIGRQLLGAGTGQVGNLFEAQNWAHAWVGAQNVVSQGWGGNLAQATAVMPAAGTNHCRWRFPEINAAFTTVQVEVWAEHVGAVGGEVRFQSDDAGDAVTLAIAPGAAASYTDTLDVSFGPGYEQVDMTIAGDGTDETIVHEVWIRYVPKTSALADGAAGDFVPFDSTERDTDSALTARQGQRAIGNLTELLARPRVYWQWSDLGSIRSGMTDIERALWVPVPYDALTLGLSLTVYVEVTQLVAASKVHIYFNDAAAGHPGTFFDTKVIDVSAGGGAPAREWKNATISLSDDQRIDRVARPFSPISIWPGTRTQEGLGGFGSAESGRQQNDGEDSPTIHTVSIWGV